MTDTASAKIGFPHMDEGQSGGEITYNGMINTSDVLFHCSVIDRDDTSPPVSPDDGDTYLLPSSGCTGDWTGEEDNFAYYVAGWYFITPNEGWRLWVEDEEIFILYDGAAWLRVDNHDSDDFHIGTVTDNITASATQTQGQQPLVSEVNRITLCPVADRVVTLPSCAAGRKCVVVNEGAQQLQVFPASGDQIQDGGTDNSVTIASGDRLILYGIDGADWV